MRWLVLGGIILEAIVTHTHTHTHTHIQACTALESADSQLSYTVQQQQH